MYQFIDLSSNNSIDSFRKVGRTSIEGAWIKVGGGGETAPHSVYTHRNFHSWGKQLRNVGVRVGGYWFAVPMLDDAKKQAQEFAERLGAIERRDLRPVLDFERNTYGLSNSALETWAHTFSQETKRLTGIGPLYYSYASYLHASVPVGYGLWLADYTNPNPPAPAPWKHYVAHQYTSRGQVSGINNNVDLSRAPKLRPLLAHPIRGLL